MKFKLTLIILAITLPLLAQIDLPPESRDYKVFWGDEPVGYYSYVLDPETGGWKMNGEMFISVRGGGQPGRLSLLSLWELDSKMRPEHYEISVYSDEELRQKIAVDISGGEAMIAEGEATHTTKFPSNALIVEMNILDGWILLPRFIDMKADSSFALPLLIPQTGEIIDAVVYPGKQEGTAGAPSRKFSVKAPGLEVEFYAKIDSRTLTYWAFPAQGLSARLTPNLNKTQIESTLTGADILGTIMSQDNIVAEINIDSPLDLIELEADINIRLTVGTGKYLKTVYQDGKPEVANGRIKGIIEIEADGYTGEKAMSYPIGPADMNVNSGMGSEPGIESEDSSIVALGIELAGDKSDVWEVAKTINRYVADEIEINTEDRGALRTLGLSSGSGLSHARLCAALLRAVGIPSRVVGGLLLNRGLWLRHHWVEVWTGEKRGWIPVDPTTGEDVSFSAAHITLWKGEGHISPSKENVISIIEYELRE